MNSIRQAVGFECFRLMLEAAVACVPVEYVANIYNVIESFTCGRRGSSETVLHGRGKPPKCMRSAQVNRFGVRKQNSRQTSMEMACRMLTVCPLMPLSVACKIEKSDDFTKCHFILGRIARDATECQNTSPSVHRRTVINNLRYIARHTKWPNAQMPSENRWT